MMVVFSLHLDIEVHEIEKEYIAETFERCNNILDARQLDNKADSEGHKHHAVMEPVMIEGLVEDRKGL